MLPWPLMIAVVAITATAAITDYRTGRIPNWLTLGGILVGILGHGIAGCLHGGWKVGLMRSGLSLGGLLFCALAPGLVYWKGGMGGGDVKLFAAIGALLGALVGIEAQMYSFVIAAVVAPIRLAYEGRLLSVLGNSLALLFNPLRSREKRRELPSEMLTSVRLGPAIFIGTALTVTIHLPKIWLP